MSGDVADIFAKLKGLELSGILGYCIESEIAAVEFYQGVKASTKGNALVSQVFDNIIRDETAHRDSLLLVHKKLFGTVKFKAPKGLPPFESSAKVTSVSALIGALGTAMQNESNAARVYAYCAKAYPKHATLFRQHAAMERVHYEALKSQRDLFEQEVIDRPGIAAKPFAKALKDDV